MATTKASAQKQDQLDGKFGGVKQVQDIRLDALTGGLETRAKSELDDKAGAELQASMNESGILVPILVRPAKGRGSKGKYQVIAGYRRVKAAENLEWRTIPAIVRELDDTQIDTARALENLNRKGNTVPESARLMTEYKRRTGLASEKIAKALGKSRGYVDNLIKAWGKLNADQRKKWLADPKTFYINDLIKSDKAKQATPKKLRPRADLEAMAKGLTEQKKRTAKEAGFLSALEWVLKQSDWAPLELTDEKE